MTIRDTSAQDRALASPATARKRRGLWLSAVAVSAIAAAVFTIGAWRDGARSVDGARLRIAEVTRGDLVRDLSAEGRVVAANSPTLYAVAGGTVSLKVVAGDAVKRDQVLAEIDSPELRSRLAQEEAALAGLEAEADRAALDAELLRADARKRLDQADIDTVAARRDLERNRRAYAGGAVAQIDVSRAEDALRKAELTLAAVRKEHALQSRGAGLDGRNKRLLVDRQRSAVAELRRQVDALALRAPFDGQVGQLFVAQRANLAANAPVLSVVDLSQFEVDIRVPESFARDLGIGVPAEVRSQNKDFAAAISAVSPEVVNGEVAARVRFADAQPPGLRQNQRLSVRIVLDTRRDVLKVERGPFLEQDGGRVAWVVTDGIAEKRAIRTGVSSLSAVEIVDGLAPGDRIVVSGADRLGDGERVRISGL